MLYLRLLKLPVIAPRLAQYIGKLIPTMKKERQIKEKVRKKNLAALGNAEKCQYNFVV